MANLSTIRVTQNPEIRLHEFGEGQRYAIVDDFLQNPRQLLELIAAQSDRFISQPLGHPMRGPDLGESVIQDILQFVRSRLSRSFPFHRAGLSLKAFFSNVSLQPEQLSAFHRICHIDPRSSPRHHVYAGVIYLFDNPDLGGTGFYRWKNMELAIKGYQLAKQDPEAAQRYLQENSEVFRRPSEYMTSSNDIAELLAVVPAQFNRMVFYDGEFPHSGHITHPELLSEDPLKGRTTLNFFANVIPHS